MASKVMQFFAEPTEITEILHRLAEQLGVSFYVKADDGLRSVEDSTSANRVFISEAELDVDGCIEGHLRPAQWGLVLLDLPRVTDRTLLMSVLAARTDWNDGTTSWRSDDAARLHRRVKAVFRPLLHYPLRGRNRLTGQTVKYNDIGYTDGAAAWACSGGMLQQNGVANVEFLLEPPARQD
jgi:hypothetical protein